VYFQNLIAKYKTAEQWMLQYSRLYWYPVDYYMLDENQRERLMSGEMSEYEFYVDKVVNFFKVLPKKTLYVRILAPEAETEQDILGYILTTGFEVCVPDVQLRQEEVSLRVGDVVASAGVFEELAQLKSFEQFTKPVFVRFVQDIKPSVFVLQHNNVLEWRMRVSEADVVFRLAV
jgi:hypothetical protein